MGDKTGIEWSDATWNPFVGCSILTPGCKFCYAMREAARIIRCAEGSGRPTHYAGTIETVKDKPVWTGELALAPDHILTAPLRWKKPRRIFVNSMGDLFHEDAPDEWIDRVFAVMALCPQHQFQILTKRAERMRDYFTQDDGFGRWGYIEHRAKQMFDIPPGKTLAYHGESNLPNVWLGVSAERQKEADERIPVLLDTPAAIRFVSCEPLLGPIDLTDFLMPVGIGCEYINAGMKQPYPAPSHVRAPLDWVITGGESGKSARPMHPEWARALLYQCQETKTAFLFKQWGEWAPGENVTEPPSRTERTATWFAEKWSFGTITPRGSEEQHRDDEPDLYRVGRKRCSRMLDGRTWDQFPENLNG